MEIWINPACSKCRTALSELDAADLGYTVRRYLDDPPPVEELRAVVERLGVEPWQIARAAETAAAGVSLPQEPEHREDWLRALSQHPQIIQRPIITADDGTTVVGRDPESLRRVIDTAR